MNTIAAVAALLAIGLLLLPFVEIRTPFPATGKFTGSLQFHVGSRDSFYQDDVVIAGRTRIDTGLNLTLDFAYGGVSRGYLNVSVFSSYPAGAPADRTAPRQYFRIMSNLSYESLNITWSYPSGETSGLDEQTLRLYAYEPQGAWIQPSGAADPGRDQVHGMAPRFGLFGIFGEPPAADERPDSGFRSPRAGGGSFLAANTTMIRARVLRNESRTWQVEIKNSGAEPVNVRAQIRGFGRAATLSDSDLRIEAEKSGTITIRLDADETIPPGFHAGQLVLNSGTFHEVIDIFIEVKERLGLLDLRVEVLPEYKSAHPGHTIIALVEIERIGLSTVPVEVYTRLRVIDAEKRARLEPPAETITLTTHHSAVHSLALPADLPPGHYALVAAASAPNMTATAFDTFQVVGDAGIQTIALQLPGLPLHLAWSIALFVVLCALATLTALLVRRAIRQIRTPPSDRQDLPPGQNRFADPPFFGPLRLQEVAAPKETGVPSAWPAPHLQHGPPPLHAAGQTAPVTQKRQRRRKPLRKKDEDTEKHL